MPFDSNGNATIQRNRAVTGQTVEAAQVNVPFDDVQSMLSQVLVKTGVAPMQGSLNMNSFKAVNVGDPTNDGDAANKNYVDDSIAAVSGNISANARKIETLSVARPIVLSDKSTFFRVTSAVTLPLTAAATLGDDFWFQVQATNGNVTIDPDGAELINGQSTFIIQQGQVADILCDVNQFRAYVYGDTMSGSQLQGYSFGLTLSNNAGDAANDIDVTSGKAAADVSPFNLMVLPSAITKRIDANWAFGTNQGGLDIGSVAASSTYYIWLIQRSDTLVTDVLFSLSNTSPTMPASYDRKRLVGRFYRETGVNGTVVSALSYYGIGYDQVWQDVPRLVNVAYRNDTPKPIEVFFYGNGGAFQVSTDNSTWLSITSPSFTAGSRIIPSGNFYRYFGGTLSFARELR